MKLQILVPQYDETDAIIKPLLDSIAIQQNIPFEEAGVVICNDGSDVALSDEFLKSYPFSIEYFRQEHRGVSAARNACLDRATADYVMFCDADDMFYNACGLWIIFREMEAGFDSLISVFTEETKLPGTEEKTYISHEQDSTFVHGKVHRRGYLLENKIRWSDSLTIHEDSFFNILCQNLSPNIKYCRTPFYLWRWRDASVCRHDPKYILKTYKDLIASNDALIDEFLKRGMLDKAAFYVAFMIFDAYYTMNKPEWKSQENRQCRDSTERRFAGYFRKREDLWDGVSVQERMQISAMARNRSISEGMQMESITIDGWLRRVRHMQYKRKKQRIGRPDTSVNNAGKSRKKSRPDSSTDKCPKDRPDSGVDIHAKENAKGSTKNTAGNRTEEISKNNTRRRSRANHSRRRNRDSKHIN